MVSTGIVVLRVNLIQPVRESTEPVTDTQEVHKGGSRILGFPLFVRRGGNVRVNVMRVTVGSKGVDYLKV